MPDEKPIVPFEPADCSGLSPVIAWLVRAAFLLLAATAAVGSLFVTARARSVNESASYVCPMHPDVVRTEAGECPLCNMALQQRPTKPASVEHASPSSLSLSVATESTELRRHDIVDTVKKRALPRDVRDPPYPAWVEGEGTVVALLYRDVMQTMVANETATFRTSIGTAETVVEVAFVEGRSQRWDGSTMKVYFTPIGSTTMTQRNDRRPTLINGLVGWLRLQQKPRDVLVVPQTAILHSPTGPYVLASSDDGLSFTKRNIELGETYQGLCLSVVLSGLKERERIVARNTFFIESERRLQVTAGSAEKM